MSPSSGPEYGWYGDDLTGATDTLATISRRGHRAFLFLDVPSLARCDAVGRLDALGIAGAARAMTPDAMREYLPPVARFFAELSPRLVHYKCCSTFDSAPDIGNIATAIELFRPSVSNPVVAILGGQPSLGRYCAFSTLFAAAGSEVHRIDRHPTMSRHPSTPMTEADLRLHFARLGLDGLHAIHWPAVAADAPEAWRAATAANPPAVLVDALDARHIDSIGGLLRAAAARQPMLAVGASSVAEAWFGQSSSAIDGTIDSSDGPTLAFAGSLSPVTRSQVAAATSFTLIELQARDLASDSARRAEALNTAATKLRAGRNVLISTAPRQGDAPSSAAPGLAEASARLLDDVLHICPVRRLAIAGGDTSSIAVKALGFWGMAYHGLASRGVAVCRGRHDDPARDGMLLMLKGGQMGHATLFDDFAGAGRVPPAATDTRPTRH